MSSEYRHLYRSRNQRMLFGVCGGLGEYFKIDPTLVRLAFVVASLMGGPGLIAYVVLLIVVPEEPLEVVESTVVDTNPVEETTVADQQQ